MTTLLGVDFIETAVQRARRRFPTLTFATESIFSLGKKYRAQFDAVACLEVLYYVKTQERSAALRSLSGVLRRGGYAVFSSLIGPPPHFSTGDFLDLIGSEFEIIAVETLHLRLVSFLEKAGSRLGRLIQRLDRPQAGSQPAYCLGRLPFSTVVTIEKWSRPLKGLSASHTIVLARVRV